MYVCKAKMSRIILGIFIICGVKAFALEDNTGCADKFLNLLRLAPGTGRVGE
jgi:hypothetical protein